MKTEENSQPAVSNPAHDQGTTKGRPLNKKVSVSEKTPDYLLQRFQGDGVRYKAKLIGVDDVAEAQGDKMCLDSMMKLKGQELAARHRGLHKQRVWLKVSDTCVRIIDEKTGAVEHEHELEKINSVKKDESQPRAFSYIYGHEGTFTLFFIKMANLADPVIEDIRDAFQMSLTFQQMLLSTQQQQNGPCLLLDEHVAVPQKGPDITDLFNPVPSSPTPHSALTSCQDELNSVFSDFSGTSAPANPTLEAGSPAPATWGSCSATGFFGQLAVASPTSWAPAGRPSAPSPGSLGPWGPAGQPNAPSLGSLGPWGPTGQPSAPSPGCLGPWGPAGQPNAPSLGSLGPWGPTGQPNAPSPGCLGPWGPAGQPSAWGTAGPWDQQQTVSGWAQPSTGTQAGAQPLNQCTQQAGLMGQVSAGYFTTAGHVSSSGEIVFPQLSVASVSHQHTVLQSHPGQVSNVFNIRPFEK